MQFYSTNRKVTPVSFKEAVIKGLPDDNGLFMPERIPHFPSEFIKGFPGLTFQEIAFQSARLVIESEIDDADLKAIVDHK